MHWRLPEFQHWCARLGSSIKHNLTYYLSIAVAGLVGIGLLLISGRLHAGDLLPLAMLLSNTYGEHLLVPVLHRHPQNFQACCLAVPLGDARGGSGRHKFHDQGKRTIVFTLLRRRMRGEACGCFGVNGRSYTLKCKPIPCLCRAGGGDAAAGLWPGQYPAQHAS